MVELRSTSIELHRQSLVAREDREGTRLLDGGHRHAPQERALAKVGRRRLDHDLGRLAQPVPPRRHGTLAESHDTVLHHGANQSRASSDERCVREQESERANDSFDRSRDRKRESSGKAIMSLSLRSDDRSSHCFIAPNLSLSLLSSLRGWPAGGGWLLIGEPRATYGTTS